MHQDMRSHITTHARYPSVFVPFASQPRSGNPRLAVGADLMATLPLPHFNNGLGANGLAKGAVNGPSGGTVGAVSSTVTMTAPTVPKHSNAAEDGAAQRLMAQGERL